MQTAIPIVNQESTGVRSIEPKALFRWLAAGRPIIVLDVRETWEIERAQKVLRGARQIPAHQLFMRRDELPSDKRRVIVAVSNTGTRSHAAAFTLWLLGHTDVYSLQGGLDAWARSGLPFE
jgi:rhodanese-related sulfurtransferase